MSHLWPKIEKRKPKSMKYIFMLQAEKQLNVPTNIVVNGLIEGLSWTEILRLIPGLSFTDNGLQVNLFIAEPTDTFLDLRSRFISILGRMLEADEDEHWIVSTDRYSMTATRVIEFNGYAPKTERPKYIDYNKNRSGRARANRMTIEVELED